jgi:UDP-N-acetylmuramate dehydrogenase
MKIERDFDLTLFNSYRIKSFCKTAYFPATESDFVSLYKESLDSNKIILGGGYNVILSKEYYDEDFVIIGDAFSSVHIHNEVIEAEAGVDLRSLAEIALDNSLCGLEIFYDIPSSLGGAVVMNAGASGEEIKDILIKVRYLDLLDLQIKEISQENIDFRYRDSLFQRSNNKIVLKAWLHLQKGDAGLIREKMDRVKEARWAKQPKDLPNGGSVFKRPSGFYVGTMIESLKLKGLTVGGAQISEKHAGFIVNKNNASGRDVVELINIIKEKVYNEYGVHLEVEQRII